MSLTSLVSSGEFFIHRLMLSLVMPAHNEESSIREAVRAFHQELVKVGVSHEIIVVNDHSTDETAEMVGQLSEEIAQVELIDNARPNGFGFAVRSGLDHSRGDFVAVVMADLSDSPTDLVRFYRKAQEGYDCVFGSRFIKSGKTVGYPKHKLVLNRLLNHLIRVLFGIRYNDTTNAFKLYRRSTIEGLRPILSRHFNLTVELPLKAIVRGYSYVVLPNSWTNRTVGRSNLKIKEMGGRYFFIILYCLLEKWLSGGDYLKRRPSEHRL